MSQMGRRASGSEMWGVGCGVWGWEVGVGAGGYLVKGVCSIGLSI